MAWQMIEVAPRLRPILCAAAAQCGLAASRVVSMGQADNFHLQTTIPTTTMAEQEAGQTTCPLRVGDQAVVVIRATAHQLDSRCPCGGEDAQAYVCLFSCLIVCTQCKIYAISRLLLIIKQLLQSIYTIVKHTQTIGAGLYN